MTPDQALDQARQRLIFALDVASPEVAREYVERLRPEISFFKVGLELFLASGTDLVRWLVDERLRVFLDIKLLDIPATVERAVRVACGLGVEVITVHADPAAVAAACRGREHGRPQVFAVTVLTSQRLEGGAKATAVEVGKRAQIAAEAGADGVIAAGHPEEIAAVRKAGVKLRVISPGIRAAGEAAGDQQRVATPGDAIRAGSDYLVVGRPIRDAADPLAAARAIISEMATAFAD